MSSLRAVNWRKHSAALFMLFVVVWVAMLVVVPLMEQLGER